MWKCVGRREVVMAFRNNRATWEANSPGFEGLNKRGNKHGRKGVRNGKRISNGQVYARGRGYQW